MSRMMLVVALLLGALLGVGLALVSIFEPGLLPMVDIGS